jgi:hypothetical protein
MIDEFFDSLVDTPKELILRTALIVMVGEW